MHPTFSCTIGATRATQTPTKSKPVYVPNGGGFAVITTSPISPTGLSVLAENLRIDGPLSVGGELPLLGTVALEGTLPSRGPAQVHIGVVMEMSRFSMRVEQIKPMVWG